MINEYYKAKLEQGLAYQDFISDRLGIISYASKKYQELVGENKLGLEIKFDNEYKNTGNLYIELSEKTDKDNAEFIDSGILRDDNSCLYLIGNYAEAFLFSKRTLIALKDKLKNVRTPTSKGFLLDKAKAQEYCLKNFKFLRKEKL